MISYSTNQMGPWHTQWYVDNGIPYTKILKYNRVLGQEIEVITPEYYVAAGRIDIRDASKEGYDGWDEYSVPPMKQVSWNLLSDWLWDLETETLLEYDELLKKFEKETEHKIEWVKEIEL